MSTESGVCSGQRAPRRSRLLTGCLVALAISFASCRRAPDETQLVVGIQSDPMGGVVTAMHVIIRVAGEVVDDEIVKPTRGSRVGFPQPWEKSLSGAGKGPAKVDVEVDAIGDPNGAPLFKRLSSSHFSPGK